jgi:hypothetical protein
MRVPLDRVPSLFAFLAVFLPGLVARSAPPDSRVCYRGGLAEAIQREEYYPGFHARWNDRESFGRKPTEVLNLAIGEGRKLQIRVYAASFPEQLQRQIVEAIRSVERILPPGIRKPDRVLLHMVGLTSTAAEFRPKTGELVTPILRDFGSHGQELGAEVLDIIRHEYLHQVLFETLYPVNGSLYRGRIFYDRIEMHDIRVKEGRAEKEAIDKLDPSSEAHRLRLRKWEAEQKELAGEQDGLADAWRQILANVSESSVRYADFAHLDELWADFGTVEATGRLDAMKRAADAIPEKEFEDGNFQSFWLGILGASSTAPRDFSLVHRLVGWNTTEAHDLMAPTRTFLGNVLKDPRFRANPGRVSQALFDSIREEISELYRDREAYGLLTPQQKNSRMIRRIWTKLRVG